MTTSVLMGIGAIIGSLAIVLWLTIATFRACRSRNSDSDSLANVFIVIAGGFLLLFATTMLMYFAWFEGNPSDLKPDVVYYNGDVYKSKANRAILELKPRHLTNKYYLYAVNCSFIRGGCPEVWPKKFQVSAVGENELVIIPIEIEKTKAHQ